MGEVWRALPEFPNYEITQDGDVRNKDTRSPISETLNKTTGSYYYALRKRNGDVCSRHYWGLIYSAYPELLESWTPVPDFPGYLYNDQGEVMGTKHYKKLSKDRWDTFILRKGGKRYRWQFKDLEEQDAA